MKKRTKSSYYGMEASTTSKDWGFKPIPGKGGQTTNCEVSEKARKIPRGNSP